MEQEFFDSAQLKAHQVILELRTHGVAWGELSLIAMFIAFNASSNIAESRNESISEVTKEFTAALESFAWIADSGEILKMKF